MAGRASLGPGREFDLIRRFIGQGNGPRSPRILVDAGDDAAVIEAGRIAVTVDLSVEGVHFRAEWLEPHRVGVRAAAGALSDLAAVAAEPLAMLVSLAIDPARVDEYGPAIMDGVREMGEQFETTVVGGDLSRSLPGGPIVVDVVCIGQVDEPVLRSGGCPGDLVWVTGTLGASAAAVRLLDAGADPSPGLRRAFEAPTPRIREARWLVERASVHAMIDLSDGLASDVRHIAAASNIAIELDAGAVPLHPETGGVYASEPARRRAALTGGEDYELCVLAPPGTLEEVAEGFRTDFGVPLTPVGRVVSGSGVAVLGLEDDSPPLQLRGYDHFAPEHEA